MTLVRVYYRTRWRILTGKGITNSIKGLLDLIPFQYLINLLFVEMDLGQ